MIHKLDKFEIEDKHFAYENANWKFDFTLAYPKVSRVSKFYSSRYLKMTRTSDRSAIESMNTSINVDYTNLFIKKIEFVDKTTGEATVIDVDDYSIDELFEIIAVFPQDVLYADNGLIQHITAEFVTKINDTFEKHECYMCGKLCENTADSSSEGFF